MIIDRRRFLAMTSAVIAGAAGLPKLSYAQNPSGKPLHGLSAFGDLKYLQGFSHFDYASPDAPTGGTFAFQPAYWYFNQNVQTFNTLNSFVRKGDAPPRMEMCFDALVVSSHDEPDAVYCHLAESVVISDDRNSFTFKIRDIAHWHDGSPITAEDVAFSFKTIKEQGHPELSLPLAPLKEARIDDPMTITLVFDGSLAAQDILSIAGLPIISKAWYTDNVFDASTLTPPLASGPYKVGRMNPGVYIEYERVDDYWAKELGTAKGFNHFQTIRIDFFKERQAGFEAFKKGATTFRQEFTSKSWATEYDFPAIQDGRVIKAHFDAEKRPRMQAWCLNMRRERFKDKRVRDAIAQCFDFEWTNRNLFYGLNERSHSIFAGSQYEAAGTPDAAETDLLKKLSVDHELPEGIYDDAYRQPASDGSGRDRNKLRGASKLLADAGWKPGDKGYLRNAKGETLDLEFLISASVFERIYGPFVETMRAVGINASLRLVDPAQYQARTSSFDFDMAGLALGWSPTPTASDLDTILGSKSAEIEGTRNWPALTNPLVDAIIYEIGAAETRERHETSMRVLDRVLRLTREWIPNWRSANHRVAYWDIFGFKEPKPDYFWQVEALWWIDKEKADKLGKG
ncbi:extracellular solute-binding protein [Ahrensia sp. 13_GOM-1096m]|uniref:extracellular solute-binding protein n=1 Tax=Ahrensia sp. 13_GOM-1096m TaxID=1380380 RepID=UPI00047B3360|nr:extracellular solute-binding protein [Ahrensia sp. 13_GOM-1096m]